MNLTKTEYLLFLKHRTWLWLKKHAKDKLPPVDANTQAVFDAGNQLEAHAERLFPGGLRLGFNSYDEYQSLSYRTKQALKSGNTVLFQARFDTENLTCLTDIVEFTSPTSINLYEVKSSTKVKPEHAYDLAFQTHVLEKSGYSVQIISVIHIDSSYRRLGTINPEELLKIVDITEEVREKGYQTEAHIEQALKVASSPTMPDPSPRYCRLNSLPDWLLIFRSLKSLPEASIYDLAMPSAQLIANLEDAGIELIQNIPNSVVLSEKQLRHVESIKQNTTYIDTESLRTFLNNLTYPLYFFDYETCSSAIPPYDGVSPYQQVPCQYSLHILDYPEAELRHSEYLHTDTNHPGQALAAQLKKDIGPSGSVIVWYAPFEMGRNSEMAELFQEYAHFFKDLNSRVVDLMVPFSEGMYVDKAFKGSASIKKVLPVLVPELSYEELAVQEGQTAQRLWMLAVLEGKGTKAENEQLFKNLLSYCELDTLAMVKIYQKLYELAYPKIEITTETAAKDLDFEVQLAN